jgi:hypothetical protein
VKIPVCPTNPAWEDWECKAQGRNLADTMQKATLEALTTFCGKHPDEVADSVAKVIPVPERVGSRIPTRGGVNRRFKI